MHKPMVNLELIRKCRDAAKKIIRSETQEISYRNRVTVQNNEFLMSEVQNDFQGAAYVAYLVGNLGLIEFKTCLYFDRQANLNLLFSMVETQPDHVTLNNLRNMTKQKLTEKLLNNIVEFVHEYRGR